MNNPNGLTKEERGITPVQNFGKGINFQMSKARRKAKQDRHKANAAIRMEKSQNKT